MAPCELAAAGNADLQRVDRLVVERGLRSEDADPVALPGRAYITDDLALVDL